MVKSYIDTVKQKSRKKLREFIRDNLLRIKHPSQIKVVCFPGAEAKGEEAIEVKEVYDTLGIPRENITGLENDIEKAKRLNDAGLGIKVVNAKDLEFLSTTPDTFDIISLDYTSHQGGEQLESLDQIAGRHLLGKMGVLATNYSGKRESPSIKKRLIVGRIIESTKSRAEAFGLPKIGYEEHLQALQNYVEGNEIVTLTESRDVTITATILKILKKGSYNLTIPKIVTSYPFSNIVNNLIGERLREFFSTEEGKKVLKLRQELGTHTLEESLSAIERPEEDQRNWIDLHHYSFAKWIELETGRSKNISKSIATLLHHSEIKPYHADRVERYSYNSNKNALMLMDFLLINQHERDYKMFQELVSFNPDSPEIRINPLDLTQHRWNRKMSTLSTLFYGLDHQQIPDRVYLGNSWVPPKRKEKISKEGAIELLKDGCNPSEIEECYSGFSKMQLAGLKAHITRGTYKS